MWNKFVSEVDTEYAECLKIAERVIESSIILNEMKRTDPSRLNDAERFEWRQELDRFEKSAGAPLVFACASLWSESASVKNGSKRNWDYADLCMGSLGLRRSPYSESEGQAEPSYFTNLLRFEANIHLGVWELMQTPYEELSTADKLALRSLFKTKHSHPLDTMRGGGGGCYDFYPHLLFGRWTPLFTGSSQRQGERRGGERVQRNGFLGIYNGAAITCQEKSTELTMDDGYMEWDYDSEQETCYRR